MSASDFVLLGLALPDGVDPLAMWRMPEPSSAFRAASESASQVLTWRIDLPTAGSAAANSLETRARDLTQRSAWLTELAPQARHLETLPNLDILSARDDLRQIIGILQQSGSAYAEGAPITDEIRKLWEQGSVLIERFRQLVSYAARIATRIEGRDVGITTVSWTGDFSIHWLEGISEANRESHLQAVHLALASRWTLIRFIGIVVQGAAELAAKAVVPGGQVLLIPAVYRLLRDLWQAWPVYRTWSTGMAEPSRTAMPMQVG